MTLEQVYYIAEIVAVIGILVSLVLVLVQLRQTQNQLEKTQVSTEFSVELAIGTAVQNSSSALVESAELRAVLRKARLGKEALSGVERGLYSAYLFVFLMPAQTSYLAVIRGVAIDDIFASNAAIVCDAVNCEEGRAWVLRNETRFDPKFRAALKGMAGLGPIAPPGLPEGYPLPERHDLIEGGKWVGVTASSTASAME
ncbi:MAG: hypothetical protein ACPG1C_01825 [Alphaproteobacteria bacterium]